MPSAEDTEDATAAEETSVEEGNTREGLSEDGRVIGPATSIDGMEESRKPGRRY